MRAVLCGALCILTFLSLCGIYLRGYTASCFLLVPLAVMLVWRLLREDRAAAELCWCQGHWTLQQGARQRRVVLSRRSTVTPWVIHLAFSDLSTGSRGQLWIYADSLSSEAWRQLRVRLALLH